MTNIDQFYRKECNKIDARCVNAYLELKLDEENPVNLILNSPWEQTSVDLTDAVKAAETVTHLFLTPDCGEPLSLQYNPERGDPDCITGDELSRIISMHLLKDVDQETAPVNGDVYIYKDGKFYAFNLTQALTNISDGLNAVINQLRQRIVNLETMLVRPQGIPDNTKIVWGNINLISDYTNSDNRNWGLYTHNKDNNIANDESFA